MKVYDGFTFMVCCCSCGVQNEFTGATVDYWECADNWITEDNFPANHAPCGSDRAFFEKVAIAQFFHHASILTC